LGLMAAIAVTKVPQKAEDFRGYLLGLDTNSVEVIDHTLNTIEVLSMSPLVVTQRTNLAALGVALIHLDNADRLAILDPDGALDLDTMPSASIYTLPEPQDPVRTCQLYKKLDIDLTTNLNPPPFLYDWDADDQNNFIAGGELPNGDL